MRILNFIKKAFIQTLKEKKIPFKEILIKRVDENALGKLFFHMVLRQ